MIIEKRNNLLSKLYLSYILRIFAEKYTAMEKRIFLKNGISGTTYMSEDKRIFYTKTACEVWESKIKNINRMFPKTNNPQLLMDIEAKYPDTMPHLIMDIIDSENFSIKNVVLFSFRDDVSQKELREAIGLCDESDVYYDFNNKKFDYESWYKTLIPGKRYVLFEYLDSSYNVYQSFGTIEEFTVKCLEIINNLILCWTKQ